MVANVTLWCKVQKRLKREDYTVTITKDRVTSTAYSVEDRLTKSSSLNSSIVGKLPKRCFTNTSFKQ